MWPPLSFDLAVSAPVLVGRKCATAALAFLFSAAAWAALALEASVSLAGSPGWSLAMAVALAIHIAFFVTSSSCLLISLRIVLGTRCFSTAPFVSLSAASLVSHRLLPPGSHRP